MIKKIHPSKLNIFLARNGPYIYYYNGNGVSGNIEIVQNIFRISFNYPMLQIFEINWKDQMIYNIFTDSFTMNQVFLYSRGKFVAKKQNPDEKELKELFVEAFKCYNYNIDIRAKNQGLNCKITKISDKGKPNLTEHRLRKRHFYNIELKRKLLLNQKIRFPTICITEPLHPNYPPHNFSFKFKKNSEPKTNLYNNYVNYPSNYKQINNEESILLPQKPCFYDFKTRPLPSDIIFNDQINNGNMESGNTSLNGILGEKQTHTNHITGDLQTTSPCHQQIFGSYHFPERSLSSSRINETNEFYSSCMHPNFNKDNLFDNESNKNL